MVKNTNEILKQPKTKPLISCYHCGEIIENKITEYDRHEFCCEGCATVYDLLKENDLCQYYEIDGVNGLSPDHSFFKGKYDYLDLPEVEKKLTEFTDGHLSRVNWLIPKMHCSSCIWLLEQLHRLNPVIRSSVVNFPEKTVRITYDCEKLKLSQLATLIAKIGYEPYISLNDVEGKQVKKWNRTRLYKIGISGFAFGNIMMLSFPEYFSSGADMPDPQLRLVFDLLNLILALPVFCYCAFDFFKSAWAALRQKYLNIDAPIVLALTSILLVSLYQIFTRTGPGYLDSLTGGIFFILIGRYFQDKTYSAISFDRDYKSYFPVAVSVISGEIEKQKLITELVPGDRIRIRNEELIPCDSVLLSPHALIDYSFVSGEATPQERKNGDTIYAGGKLNGSAIELEILSIVSKSYLTQLWNNDSFNKDKDDLSKTLATRINRYFSSVVLLIAILTFIAWFFIFKNHEKAFLAFTTCLLVACPCALLLSSTFTNGNLLTLFGKNKFYLKNANTIERLAKIDTIVFDKTGPITQSGGSETTFNGPELTDNELIIIKTLAAQSSHPLSRALIKSMNNIASSKKPLINFIETSGSGIAAIWDKQTVKLGSAEWVGVKNPVDNESHIARVYAAFNQDVKGYFSIRNKYREKLEETISLLREEGFGTYLLSGDKPTDRAFLTSVFGGKDNLLFEQKPEDKLRFIENLQKQFGRNVLMIGDGLNDAGALRQSDVGLAVSDNVNNFSPACDAIVEGSQLRKLPAYIKLAKSGQRIIKLSFILSLFYNVFGLCYAVTGYLSPVFAAILMPLSSISIVAFTTVTTNLAARKYMKSDECHE
jgi:Cu+-exporting ATPase